MKRLTVMLLVLFVGCSSSRLGDPRFHDGPAFQYIFPDQNGRTIVSTWAGHYRLENDGSLTPVKEVDRLWVLDPEERP